MRGLDEEILQLLSTEEELEAVEVYAIRPTSKAARTAVLDDETNVQRHSLSLEDVNSPMESRNPHVSRVKLPNLSFKKFGGDITSWCTFWDLLDSAVHSNKYLSNVDKFNYLISFLEGSAAECISGLTLTSANYEEAIAVLKQRFGIQQQIVNHLELDTINNPSPSNLV